jgi:uncharacterized protein (TIGR02594 family)
MFQPPWLEHAWGDLGIAEAPAGQNNPAILRYYAEVGHADVAHDDVAWCAAFLGACLERAGVASTRSLMARSYLAWGEPLAEPRLGAIAVLSRGADPTLGHTAFLVGVTPAHLVLLGGNQSDAVTVEAYPRARLLGLRWPAAVPAPVPEPVPGARETSDFERALAHVLEMEGGWTDDPYDPGGPTNFGITLAVYAREIGAEVTPATLETLKAELKRIPQTLVRRIYLERYWGPACCPQLPPALALFHFDTAVNQGVTGAARMLQEAVGTLIDGEIGPITLAAVSAAPIERTLTRYADLRRARYRALSTFWRFGRGWLNRVDATLALARRIAAATPSPEPPQAKENPMSTEPATPEVPATDTASKWWGQSMTIWGVIITTLSTVLPTVAPIFGYNITAELIQQLGDQLVLVGQALGGLIGTLLTIFGRVRATASLERRAFTLNM